MMYIMRMFVLFISVSMSTICLSFSISTFSVYISICLLVYVSMCLFVCSVFCSPLPRHLHLLGSVSPKEPGSDGSGWNRAHQDRNEGVPWRRHGRKFQELSEKNPKGINYTNYDQIWWTCLNLVLDILDLRLFTTLGCWLVAACFYMFLHGSACSGMFVWGWPWWLWAKNWAASLCHGIG